MKRYGCPHFARTRTAEAMEEAAVLPLAAINVETSS